MEIFKILFNHLNVSLKDCAVLLVLQFPLVYTLIWISYPEITEASLIFQVLSTSAGDVFALALAVLTSKYHDIFTDVKTNRINIVVSMFPILMVTFGALFYILSINIWTFSGFIVGFFIGYPLILMCVAFIVTNRRHKKKQAEGSDEDNP